jgi:hypothetical protein
VSGAVVQRFTTTTADATTAAAHNWPAIWLHPAIAAAAVMVLFAILFRPKIPAAAPTASR